MPRRPPSEPPSGPLAKALELLSRRPHFRAELGRKLRERGFDPDETEVALGRAIELGYLDDERLAASFAAELAERRGLGRAGIGRELGRRGASEDAVAAALAGLDAEAELERARAAAAKWARRGGGEVAALARHLDRKGYDRHVIFRVSKEFAADAEELEAVDE